MDKRTTLAALVERVGAARSVAFGGGGLQRKPMAAARAIAASAARDLDVVSLLGGPEVDLLVGAGKVRRLSFAFVGFDAFGLAPHFRRARESAAIEAVEYSEASMLAAFEAAAKRLPFLPTRFGLGTGIVDTPSAPFRRFACPITGEPLLAVPALAPEIAIVHVNEADHAGNAVIHGDGFADPVLVRAAAHVFLTAERVVETLPRDHGRRSTFISRLWVEGVIAAPGGGGFTAVYPDRPLDLPGVLDYQKRATDPAWLAAFVAEKE
jgi:glutaconate CoA-transferase subunit A